MEVRLELIEAPNWMDGLIFSREGDQVRIEVRNNNGSDYGHALVDVKAFQQMFAILGLSA